MLQLQAGKFSLNYENGFIRYILNGKTEVIRMIYFAFRDESWTTYQLIIENEKIVKEKDSFLIEYDCLNKKEEKTIFKWKVRIEGNQDGSIVFAIHGEALTDVLKNRAGLCILHPITDTPGQPVEITHTDNSVSKSKFPNHVSPVNPFKDIRSMKWMTSEEWYTLDFEGDVFETEDQRNWTDASFKTFCTPLALPSPVKLSKGTHVDQKIRFSCEQSFSNILPLKKDLIRITVDRQESQLPSIGLGTPPEKTRLTQAATNAIKKLNLSHYRIDIFTSKSDWISTFSAACVDALALGLDPEVILHLPPDFAGAIEQFAGLCIQNRLKIKQLLLLQDGSPTTPQPVINSIAKLKSDLPGVLIGAGTHFNFNELNQNRFDPGAVDFISYAIHPQEHAFDNRSMIENLEAQKDTALNARMMYNGLPVHVSPVTLRKRFNPYSKEPSRKVQSDEQRTDPRQSSPFCAAWTLGSIKRLTEGQASSITYFQTIGDQGIIDVNDRPFPVYEAFNLIGSCSKKILKTQSDSPLVADAMQFSDGKFILWNYTEEKQSIEVNEQRFDLAPFELKIGDNK